MNAWGRPAPAMDFAAAFHLGRLLDVDVQSSGLTYSSCPQPRLHCVSRMPEGRHSPTFLGILNSDDSAPCRLPVEACPCPTPAPGRRPGTLIFGLLALQMDFVTSEHTSPTRLGPPGCWTSRRRWAKSCAVAASWRRTERHVLDLASCRSTSSGTAATPRRQVWRRSALSPDVRQNLASAWIDADVQHSLAALVSLPADAPSPPTRSGVVEDSGLSQGTSAPVFAAFVGVRYRRGAARASRRVDWARCSSPSMKN